MFETWVIRANECQSQRQVRRNHRDFVSIFFNMEICCVFSLESHHRGDSNEYTQHTIFNILRKSTLNYPKSAVMGFFPGSKQPW